MVSVSGWIEKNWNPLESACKSNTVTCLHSESTMYVYKSRKSDDLGY